MLEMVDMPELTRRQKQVLNELMQGRTNEQIAAKVGIDVRTVEHHLTNVYKKWNLSNRTRLNAALCVMGRLFQFYSGFQQ